MEFVEFDGMKGCVQKAILEKTFPEFQATFNTTQNGLARAQRWR